MAGSRQRFQLSNIHYLILGCVITLCGYALLTFEGSLLFSYMNSFHFNDYLLLANDSDEVYDYDALGFAEKHVSQIQLTHNRVKMDKDFHNLNVYYQEARPPATILTLAPIILLHGINANMDGTSDVWLQRNTIQIFAAAGYRVIAPDLPGTPKSRTSQEPLENEKKAEFLLQFARKVAIDQAIIFGASWGGGFALPYLFKFGADKILALVAVAPVGSEWYTSEMYEKVDCISNISQLMCSMPSGIPLG